MPPSILQRFIENGNEMIAKPFISPVMNRAAQDMDITISMLRLDVMHPFICGNKLFKLHFFLEEALNSEHKTILTFGGAYSNHLVATAAACQFLNIHSIGLVRGERPAQLSDTLVFCEQHGMKLEFISRKEYRNIAGQEENSFLKRQYGDHILIPEGGFSRKGMSGACGIAGYFAPGDYSHICMPVGTATTLAGILQEEKKEACSILGFSALKGFNDVPERLRALGVSDHQNLTVVNEYHFGGFGKKTPELVDFMNRFYSENRIPLDVVYTAKMMFGIQDLLEKKYFPAGSDILCIHTGGLQGNSSIRELLVY